MRDGDGVGDELVSGVFVTFTYAGFGCGRFMCVRHVFLWMFCCVGGMIVCVSSCMSLCVSVGDF